MTNINKKVEFSQPELFLDIAGQAVVDPKLTSGPERMRADADKARALHHGGAIINSADILRPLTPEEQLIAVQERRDAASKTRGPGVI